VEVVELAVVAPPVLAEFDTVEILTLPEGAPSPFAAGSPFMSFNVPTR
jgi:hypothetical protein